MRRKIDGQEGMRLIRKFASGQDLSQVEERTAVRFSLEEFATRHPGRSVEIRIPWAGAIQAIQGPRHTRGTPPNIVEMSAVAWLNLVVGHGVDPDAMSFSGTRSDLGQYLPLFGHAELSGHDEV